MDKSSFKMVHFGEFLSLRSNSVTKQVNYNFNFAPIKSEQLKLFEKDNVASNQHKNLKNLGINPQDLKEKIKRIVIKNL